MMMKYYLDGLTTSNTGLEWWRDTTWMGWLQILLGWADYLDGLTTWMGWLLAWADYLDGLTTWMGWLFRWADYLDGLTTWMGWLLRWVDYLDGLTTWMGWTYLRRTSKIWWKKTSRISYYLGELDFWESSNTKNTEIGHRLSNIKKRETCTWS